MDDALKEVLDFAVTKEKEAEAFYKTWSNQVSNPAIQKLFADLAEMERGHAQKLSRITSEELIAQGPAPADLKLSELLVEVEAQPNMTLQDALIVAMKREEASVALYQRLSQVEGNAQPLFSALAEEERRHKRLLETEYDDVILTDN